MADLLRPLGNDLTAAAGALAPGTGEVLKPIETSPGCPLARMSGSGATCFGLYAEEAGATAGPGALGAALGVSGRRLGLTTRRGTLHTLLESPVRGTICFFALANAQMRPPPGRGGFRKVDDRAGIWAYLAAGVVSWGVAKG
ncbi:MAG: hypothetical protein IIB65_07115 [Proteobacteria bacterium]|nr:hypothetical protein [Pseudomonadota bacterium]